MSDRAIILLGHGTTHPEGLEDYHHLAKSLKAKSSHDIREAFLQYADPFLVSAIDSCVNSGYSAIQIIPLFLSSASHVQRDLPRLLTEAESLYPDRQISVTQYLGASPLLAGLIHEEISRLSEELDIPKRALLFISRGSPYIDSQNDVQNVFNSLSIKDSFIDSRLACYSGAKPSVTDAYQELISQNPDGILIIPYLLFRGKIHTKIQQSIQSLSLSHPSVTHHFMDVLSHNPSLTDIILHLSQRSGD
ncbi:MAG: sirohydrochlorin chelatase [Spirochaetota bacterium]|nr:sirohydrochlorin chelatase [Spirochaetota bacterium]